MPERLLRLPVVLERTAHKKTAFYEGMKRGDIPRPVRIGGRAVAWRESEINAWIAERAKVEA